MTILSVDFHTHILPGIDDGSPSVEESIQMLHMAYSQGVNSVFLTPHFVAQQMYPEAFLASRNQALKMLQDQIVDDPCVPELIPGAEVKYCPGISKWEALDQLALGDTRHILIELSPFDLTSKTFEELAAIYHDRDMIPVIAHVERYLNFFNRRSVLKKLSYLPVILQYNCNYFVDEFTRKAAFRLLNNRQVHLISSDCHSLTWRPPCMQQARDLILSSASWDNISFLSDIEKRVLNSNISKNR